MTASIGLPTKRTHALLNILRRWLGAVLTSAAIICFSVPGFAQSPQPKQSIAAKAEATLWENADSEEVKQAVQVLEHAANADDSVAQRFLGLHLLNGWVLKKDVDQGLAWLEKSADAGDAKAQAALGQAFLFGTQAQADTGRALSLLETAAGQNEPSAMRNLGEQLVGGWAFPRDSLRGRALLEKAIALGDTKSQVVLGKLLLNGFGLEVDQQHAADLFEAAADAGNGEGLAAYGEYLMWRMRNPAEAEEILVRAGELGAGGAWTTLAHGAMYGYLGGGAVSRSKFDGYAQKARAAGQDEIAVLDATRNMWGINMRASGPQTIARLRVDADNGNAAAARFLIELLRDGNGLNLRRKPDEARAALDSYGHLLSEKSQAQYALTLNAANARTPSAYAPVAAAFVARPDLKSIWFGKELVKANPNVAFYILQVRFRDEGTYSGPLDGYATRRTLRAVFKACLGLDHSERCNDNVMRPDVIAALLAQ